ncbi:MAG: hypothetical protein D6826_12215 [Alphaproteobacteria bacterium]|nr:MAG: hypothetical protein D6826_12215 [Alphaproteobacteria bacterium]
MTATDTAMGVLDRRLSAEILSLINYIERLRKEIAGIAHKPDDQTHFEGMADRLDAIIHSTAEATETILSAMERIDTAVEKLRTHPDPATVDALCDQITEHTTQAMEACSFQDLTGQRVSKVIGSLRFVEERVNAMADICGRKEIERMGRSLPPQAEQQIDDGVPLDGPQSAGKGISQDEIDQLFA